MFDKNIDRKIGEVWETTNLEKFVCIKENRTIDKCHVRELVKSIKENGYVGESIIVNEKLEVIDGQHRLEACKLLKVEGLIKTIPYQIKKGYGQKEMSTMNKFSKNWDINTYVDSFAAGGQESYDYINLIKEDYKISVSALIEILFKIRQQQGINKANNNKKQIKDSITDGTFEITEEEVDEIQIFLNIMLDIHIKLYNNKPLNLSHIGAYLELYYYKDFNLDFFQKSLDINSEKNKKKAMDKIQKFRDINPTNKIDILACLIDIYSDNRSKQTKIGYDKTKKIIYTL